MAKKLVQLVIIVFTVALDRIIKPLDSMSVSKSHRSCSR